MRKTKTKKKNNKKQNKPKTHFWNEHIEYVIINVGIE